MPSGRFGSRSWDSDTWVSTPSAERTLLIVQAVFKLALLAGLLILSLGVFLVKRLRRDALKPMPVSATQAAILSMVASLASTFAYDTVKFRAHYTKQIHYVALLIGELFSLASYCLMFYVFYAVIQVLGKHVTKINTKTLSAWKYMHLGIVSLFGALCIIDWSWYFAAIDSMVKTEWSFSHRMKVWEMIDSIRWIVFWLSALEIAAWAIYLGLMTSRDSSYLKFKMSAYLFVAASAPFLGVNFLWFIWDILAFLQSSSETFTGDVTNDGKTAREIALFVLIDGLFLGLLLCYWRFPAQERQHEDSEFELSRFIDHTGVALSELERSKQSTRNIGRMVTGNLADADAVPNPNGQTAEAGCSELMADSSWNTNRNGGTFEADGSRPILEADSKHVFRPP